MGEDRRIRKTKKVLKESLFELMAQKPMNQITVKEIVERADVNRSTFYNYYTDVLNMVVCIEEEVYQQFLDSIQQTMLKKQELGLENATELSLDFISDIGRIAKDNPAFCKCIFSDYGDIAFINRINELIEDNTKALFEEIFHRDYKHGTFLYSFIKGGIFGNLKRWMDNDFAESPEEISKVIYHFISSLIRSSLTENKNIK